MVSCEFSNPIVWDGTAPLTKQDTWNFSKMVCIGDLDFSTSSVPAYFEKQNDNFYLEKTFSLSEVIFLAVLIPAIFVFLLVKIRQFLKQKYQ